MILFHHVFAELLNYLSSVVLLTQEHQLPKMLRMLLRLLRQMLRIKSQKSPMFTRVVTGVTDRYPQTHPLRGENFCPLLTLPSDGRGPDRSRWSAGQLKIGRDSSSKPLLESGPILTYLDLS